MARLQTPGLITLVEYEPAEEAGRFLIIDHLVCSYCQDPSKFVIPTHPISERKKSFIVITTENSTYRCKRIWVIPLSQGRNLVIQ